MPAEFYSHCRMLHLSHEGMSHEGICTSLPSVAGQEYPCNSHRSNKVLLTELIFEV